MQAADPLVTQTLSDLTCAVCLLVLFQPVQTACNHLFCRRCLKTALAAQSKCPTCRSPHPASVDLATANPPFQRLLDSLLVSCAWYQDAGCDWIGPHSSLSHHFNTCFFAPSLLDHVLCQLVTILAPQIVISPRDATETLESAMTSGANLQIVFANIMWFLIQPEDELLMRRAHFIKIINEVCHETRLHYAQHSPSIHLSR